MTTGGEVRAWGYNYDGQLGDGTTTASSRPAVVLGVGGSGPFTGVVQVAAGWWHSLALTAGGEVRAWGRNVLGQLGDGTTTNRSLPVVVEAVGGGGPLTAIVQVTAGADHSLALTTAGEVRAWGENFGGQLGDGTTTSRTLPVVVQAVGGAGPLTGIVQVAAGWYHSLALTTGGEVRAWGYNGDAQLGDGTTTDSWLPVVVEAVGGSGPLSGIVQVAGGIGHSLALTTGGEVRARGDNDRGLLGDGTTTDSLLPVVVEAEGGGRPLTGIVQVATGAWHSLALTSSGEVRAWGHNPGGQLGDGTTTDSSLPVVVQEVGGGGPLTGITQVEANGWQSLAVTSGGEARAWGANWSGQLGDGTRTDSSLPVVVQEVCGGGPLTSIVQVAAGFEHSLALTTGGEVRAWGDNFGGQLGDGRSYFSPVPREVTCVVCVTPVLLVKATRSGSDVSLIWEPADALSLYNVWYVTDRYDIDAARLGSTPPAVGVLGCSEPTPASRPSCVDAGAIARDPSALFYYQVRVSCDGQTEGP